MEIKDKEGITRIRFSGFRKQYIEEPVFVDIEVEITLLHMAAKEDITVELSDLEEFLFNLKKLNKNLNQTFYFQHIDEQLKIKFEPHDTGVINVTGFLKDKQHLNTLTFSFEMQPTELFHLIQQSENIVDVFGIG